MSNLEREFDFEISPLNLSDGRLHPLEDAVDRWWVSDRSPSGIEGVDFQVLYRLKNNAFVLVEVCCNELSRSRRQRKNEETFDSMYDPSGQQISPEEAYRYLVTWQKQIPPDLDDWFKSVFEGTLEEPDLPTQDPDYWENVGILEEEWGDVSEAVDFEAILAGVVDAGIRFVQDSRKWDASDPMEISAAVEGIAGPLFSQFETDPIRWPGSTKKILPPSVGIGELPWPPQLEEVRGSLQTLRELIDWPLSALTCAMRYYHPRKPTPVETTMAERELRKRMPQFEEAVVKLRQTLV